MNETIRAFDLYQANNTQYVGSIYATDYHRTDGPGGSVHHFYINGETTAVLFDDTLTVR
jgi:hypothetical protein